MPVLQQKQNTDTSNSAANLKGNGSVQFSAPVIQRYEEANGYKWSENERYATDGGTSIAASALNRLPVMAGLTWTAEGGNATYTIEAENEGDEDEEVAIQLYRPRWTAGNHPVVKVPKDCITTAELVAAWLTNQNPDVVGQVKVAPTIAVANQHTAVGVGDILFHTHSEDDGDFHGAAVIAVDGVDTITMEGDSSAGNIGEMTPMFDMYEGHAGFRNSQLQEETDDHSQDDENTYVIKFAVPGGRTTAAAETLWAGIQEEIDGNRYTAAGQAAAEGIKAVIHAHLGIVAGGDDEAD